MPLQDFGPLKRVFVVNKRRQEKSGNRTIGFAEFAFREDAERVLGDHPKGIEVRIGITHGHRFVS